MGKWTKHLGSAHIMTLEAREDLASINTMHTLSVVTEGNKLHQSPDQCSANIDSSDIIYLSILAFGEGIDCICLFT